MFLLFLIHADYAILMYSLRFRIMVLAPALAVALMGAFMIYDKGLIIAPILSFIYSFFAIGIALDDNFGWEDGTGNEFIWGWVFFCSGLCYAIFDLFY